MALQNPLLPAPQDHAETFPPAPAAGLTGGDIQRIGRTLDQSVSQNTRTMYASAWRSFQAWTDARGVMAQDLAAARVKLPALMTAGRWKSPKMPARYTEGQAAERGAVARYYQKRG